MYFGKMWDTFANVNHYVGLFNTQGVSAFKFPISILTQTQDQQKCQKIRKIAKNYVPISDFATRPLNLRKLQKSNNFFFVKNCKL